MGINLIIIGLLAITTEKAYAQCTSTDSKPLTVVASGVPQYFTSENFPSNYESNSDCAWIVTSSSADQKVIINVHEAKFDSGDSLTIYDGDSNEDTELDEGTWFAGSALNEFISSNTSLYLEFVSNYLYNQDGFEVLYFSADPAIFQPCSQTLNATLTAQYLSSSNLPEPYASGYNCTTYIQAADEFYTLRFRLYFLDVEVSKGCANDKFEILEGTDINSLTTTLTSVCTTASTYSFSDMDSIFSFASVTLSADTANNDYYGFVMSYEEVFQGINVTYPADGVIVELNTTEDADAGDIDTTNGRIVVTSTGGSGMNSVILQDGNQTTQFGLSTAGAPADTYYLSILSDLDYETTTYHNLTVIVADSTYPGLTASVFFYVSVTDVDDIAPVFTNLPGNVTIYRSATTGYSVFTVSSTDNDTTAEYQATNYTIHAGDTYALLSIDQTTGEITLAQDISVVPMETESYPIDIRAYTSSGLYSESTLELIIPADSPPICTTTTAWGNELNENLAISGTIIEVALQVVVAVIASLLMPKALC